MASAPSQAIPSPPEFTFNLADTRLKITYNNAPAYAHVYSGAMAQASPVWKNFLFPPWSGSRSTDINTRQEGKNDLSTELVKLQLEPVRELDFSEDDAEALIVLLAIAHLDGKEILDARPPVPVLVNLAILCDAYLCHDLLEPWIGQWMSKQWQYDRKCISDDAKAMMLLGWVFRPEWRFNFFTEGAKWLYKCGEEDDGDFLEFPENWPMPKT